MSRDDHPSQRGHQERVARAQVDYLSQAERLRLTGQTISLLFAYSAGQLAFLLLYHAASGLTPLAGIAAAYLFARSMDRRDAVRFQKEAEKLFVSKE